MRGRPQERGEPTGAETAGLTTDKHGDLYGTTTYGGGDGCGGGGCGTVFKLTSHGTETVLAAFSGAADGSYPLGGVIAAKGKLYGTTSVGGTYNCGTVFEVPE